jgi:hypothetical protein
VPSLSSPLSFTPFVYLAAARVHADAAHARCCGVILTRRGCNTEAPTLRTNTLPPYSLPPVLRASFLSVARHAYPPPFVRRTCRRVLIASIVLLHQPDQLLLLLFPKSFRHTTNICTPPSCMGPRIDTRTTTPAHYRSRYARTSFALSVPFGLEREETSTRCIMDVGGDGAPERMRLSLAGATYRRMRGASAARGWEWGCILLMDRVNLRDPSPPARAPYAYDPQTTCARASTEARCLTSVYGRLDRGLNSHHSLTSSYFLCGFARTRVFTPLPPSLRVPRPASPNGWPPRVFVSTSLHGVR